MMQYKGENSNNSYVAGRREMAEVQEREVPRDGEDKKGEQETSFIRDSDRCRDLQGDAFYLYHGDTQNSKCGAKSGHDSPAVAAAENFEFPPEILFQNNETTCKDEMTAPITGDEYSDLTSTDECKTKENSRETEENKENLDVPVISLHSVAESAAGLKNAENDMVSQVSQPPAGTHREAVQRGGKDGCVVVVFPGTVTQDSCCKFVCEILKCVLYQRQQLPMTYDQLMFFQRKQQEASQSEEGAMWRPSKPSGWDWRKCQRTLQDLEEVLQHLDTLFSLSLVPRVLLLLGGTIMLPKEMYEINMENLALGAGDHSLRTATCLRQLFRALFVADILSDARPVRLMTTTVMVLAHRDCGVSWFRPKLDYRVPTRVKLQLISLSSEPLLSGKLQGRPADWEDYVWFQAPVTIKGFCK